MYNEKIRLGSVVYSKSGRDSGKCFVVTEIVDENFVKIADGKYRKIDKPKLKKIKHLYITNDNFNTIADKLFKGKKIFDEELYSAIRKYTLNKEKVEE